MATSAYQTKATDVDVNVEQFNGTNGPTICADIGVTGCTFVESKSLPQPITIDIHVPGWGHYTVKKGDWLVKPATATAEQPFFFISDGAFQYLFEVAS